MFARGTILTRKEPFDEPKPAAKTEDARNGDPRHVFNRVRVIGPSPVQTSGHLAEWQGGQSQGVLVQPEGVFGPTVDRPLGELQRDYNVEFVPKVEIQQGTVRVIDATSSELGPSPEDVFREGLQEPIAPVKELPQAMQGIQ